jgi:hypothetical protein
MEPSDRLDGAQRVQVMSRLRPPRQPEGGGRTGTFWTSSRPSFTTRRGRP